MGGHRGGRVDADRAVRLLAELQTLRWLSIAEVWALPILLRLADDVMVAADTLADLATQPVRTGEAVGNDDEHAEARADHGEASDK